MQKRHSTVTRFFGVSLMAAALYIVSPRDSLDSRALSFSHQLPAVSSFFFPLYTFIFFLRNRLSIRSVFIVLTENQSESDPSQDFPELFSPSVMHKREELWGREWPTWYVVYCSQWPVTTWRSRSPSTKIPNKWACSVAKVEKRITLSKSKVYLKPLTYPEKVQLAFQFK